MASPRPGQKGYSGPVGEGWGRTAQNVVNAADKTVRDTQRSVQQHMSNAAGIGDDVLTNLFGGGTTARDRRERQARTSAAMVKRTAGQKSGSSMLAIPAPKKGAKARAIPVSKDPRNERRTLGNATAAAKRAARPAPKKKSSLAQVGAKIRQRNPGLSTKEVRARGRAMLNKRGTGKGDS